MIYSDSKYQVVKRQRLQIDHLKIASEISLFLALQRDECNESGFIVHIIVSRNHEDLFIQGICGGCQRGLAGWDGDSLGAGHEVAS